jgi:hypothetical protein
MHNHAIKFTVVIEASISIEMLLEILCRASYHEPRGLRLSRRNLHALHHSQPELVTG